MSKPSLASDTSLLLYLDRIKHLYLLPDLFESVLVPTPVVFEWVGILVKAKRAGIISAVRPVLDLAKEQGFHLHPDVYVEALQLSNKV